MKRVIIATLALCLMAAISAPAFADDAAATYKAKCAMCHGPDGAGQTPTGKTMKVRDLRSAEVRKATDAEMETIISDGKGKMPAFKGKLSPADIKGLVAYIRGLK